MKPLGDRIGMYMFVVVEGAVCSVTTNFGLNRWTTTGPFEKGKHVFNIPTHSPQFQPQLEHQLSTLAQSADMVRTGVGI